MKRLFSILFMMTLLLTGDIVAYASSGYLNTFNNTYGTSTTRLNTCSVCHTNTPACNSYGNSFANSGHNYQAIEPVDSDGDGFSNMGEIRAITFPGDPASKPVTGTSISLGAPNGGETVPSGSVYRIQWTATSPAVQFKLKHSMDNGLTWISMTTDFIAGTSYDWSAPTPSRNKKNACLVKVIGYDASGAKVGADKSSAPFTIEVVKLISPNGGDILTSGIQHTITWATNATVEPVAAVELYYTVNGGTTWKLIPATITGNPGNYSWTPTVSQKKISCKVKVVLKDMNGNTVGSDVSDSYFTIQP
jgi:hypothetical protein